MKRNISFYENEIINSIYCCHINNVVFESFKIGHDAYADYVYIDLKNGEDYNADTDEELTLYLR